MIDEHNSAANLPRYEGISLDQKISSPSVNLPKLAAGSCLIIVLVIAVIFLSRKRNG